MQCKPIYFSRISAIDKRLLPNLRRLKIASEYTTYGMGSLDQLFNCDLLLALTNFTLVGVIIGPDIVSKFLSMISEQCCYTFDVRWHRKTRLSLSDASAVLLDTFQQLKGRAPVELKLDSSPYQCGYAIEAFTLPQQNRSLNAWECSNTNIVRAYVEVHLFFLLRNGVLAILDKADGDILCQLETIVRYTSIRSISLE